MLAALSPDSCGRHAGGKPKLHEEAGCPCRLAAGLAVWSLNHASPGAWALDDAKSQVLFLKAEAADVMPPGPAILLCPMTDSVSLIKWLLSYTMQFGGS